MKSNNPPQDIAAQLLELRIEVALRYGIDLADRTIQLIGEIDESTFCYFDTAMTLLESNGKSTITIKINSEGGSVYDALAIVGRMKASKCKIITEGYGSIMSAATLILAAGEKRKMSKYAWLLHHEMSYEAGGTHEQIKHLTAQRDREEEMWMNAMGEFTTVGKEYWHQLGKSGKDLYLNSDECLKLGVIDEVF